MIRRKLRRLPRRGRNRHFIADRTGTLHHSLQSKRGKGGKQYKARKAHLEEPNWDLR
jgi:hypothetical protein